MQHGLFSFHIRAFSWRSLWSEEMAALLLAVLIFVSPAAASTRFETRSLYMNSSRPGVTTSYTVSLRYMTPADVGSVDMLFCEDPIPYMPCVTPPGLDVSHATLSSQSGETGFTIGSQSTNHIVLSRTPTMISSPDVSAYTFDGVVNPTSTTQAFSIRLKSLGSTDGSGPQIDFGSVRGQVTNDIVIETQVPPMLIFCAARVVYDNCGGTDDNYYTDMGQLSPNSTLTAQSQMAVGTNATAGFAITVDGGTMAAGTNTIPASETPAFSTPGTNQFGINLVENNTPSVGADPVGTWANAIPSPDYSIPNRFMYHPGDVIAYSSNVSLMKKFTISYIVNSAPTLRAGVYTTTITYIASGRF